MKYTRNWMTKLEGVKDQLHDIESDEGIANLSLKISEQLRKIKESNPFSILKEDDQDLVHETLEKIIDDFDYIKILYDNQSVWNEYSFDGNFEEIFNYTLSDLYDLGDYKPVDKNGYTRKVMWIG